MNRPSRTTAVFVRSASIAFAAIVIAFTIAGTYRAYSPVPYFDMWSGYLGFIHKLSAGDAGAFWAQHNEHRIVLSRVLFVLDFHLFDGTGVFLFVVNFALAGASAAIFCFALRRQDRAKRSDAAAVVASSSIVAWLFLDMQYDNFAWAFQSAFFLAQLVPLAALVTMNEATRRTDGAPWFALACVLGIASVGTMANGILCLPLLTVQAILTRQSRQRVAVLATLAVIAIAAYFIGYEPVARHGSMGSAFRDQGADVVLYVLLLLGSPWFFLFGRAGLEWVSFVGGLLFIVLTIATIRSVVRPDRRGIDVALILFIAYVSCFAIATAAGRLFIGLEYAISSRYTTPVLMAWTALFVIHSRRLLAGARQRPAVAALVVVLLGAAMLRVQWESQARRPSDPALQDLVGIALALNVHDDDLLRRTYPFIDDVRNESAWAQARHASFHAVAPFAGARARLGTPVTQVTGTPCALTIESVHRVDGEPRFVRIAGSLPNARQRTFIRVLDAGHRVIGLAVSGFRAPSGRRSGDADREGFHGYVLEPAGSRGVVADTDGRSCSTAAVLPDALDADQP